jgi:hypothetical protein
MLLFVKQIDDGGVVNVLHTELGRSTTRTEDRSWNDGDTNKKNQDSEKVSVGTESQADEVWRPHWEDKYYRGMVRR